MTGTFEHSYRVTWQADIDANSPEEAAKKALAIQRDPKPTAVLFTVVDHFTMKVYPIDLLDHQDTEAVNQTSTEN